MPGETATKIVNFYFLGTENRKKAIQLAQQPTSILKNHKVQIQIAYCMALNNINMKMKNFKVSLLPKILFFFTTNFHNAKLNMM